MVTATVTAIPSIPMQTAIATAIETVRAAGPTILSQPSSDPHSKKPTPVPPQTPQRTRSPANTAAAPAKAKGPKTVPPPPPPAASAPPASATFAQMAASVLGQTPTVPVHLAKTRPTWRAIETNKSLVLRPGTKGTRVSELHIRVPKVAATAHLFSLSGTKLINEILRLVNDTHNKEGIKALKENHLVLVKWSMRGNLIIKCSKPMDDTIKDCLHDAIKAAIPPSSADSIAILNKPPTTALKFLTVPRHNEDGSETDSYDLFNDLMAHELWRDVELFSQLRFLPMKENAAGGTVIVSIVDDNQGSIGRKLMNMVVSFSGASRCCLRWVEKEAQLFCTQCQCWGHLNYNCLSNVMRCSKCAGLHDYRQHDRFCDICKAGKGKLCIPKCHNCHGPHFSSSKECVFYLNRSSKERQVQLRDEFSQKWKEETAALKAAANSDSGRAARTAAATVVKTQGKASAKPKPRKPATVSNDDDDYIPVGRGGKAKYTFEGMTRALASTTRIDEVHDDDNPKTPSDKKGDDNGDRDSDTSSDLRLSYLDDVPLKTRFPGPQPTKTTHASSLAPKSNTKPKSLTITLPAPNTHKPLRSVTDILRGLKLPSKNTLSDPPAIPAPARGALTAHFTGGEVTYTPSAAQAEATAFASTLDNANIPSQPSPPSQAIAPPTPGNDNAQDATPEVPHSHSQPTKHD